MLWEPKALICICSDQRKAGTFPMGPTLALFDCAMAAQNMMLVAVELELGSCVMRSTNMAALREILDIPDHLQTELLLMLGYPDAPPLRPPGGMRPLSTGSATERRWRSEMDQVAKDRNLPRLLDDRLFDLTVICSPPRADFWTSRRSTAPSGSGRCLAALRAHERQLKPTPAAPRALEDHCRQGQVHNDDRRRGFQETATMLSSVYPQHERRKETLNLP